MPAAKPMGGAGAGAGGGKKMSIFSSFLSKGAVPKLKKPAGK
jgi:hypothetical protein